MNKAIFLNYEESLQIFPKDNGSSKNIGLHLGIAESLAMLKKEGYKLILILKDSVVKKEEVIKEDINFSSKNTNKSPQAYTIEIDAIYNFNQNETDQNITSTYDDKIQLPELILKASQELNIRRKNSWFIGCILSDIEAGNKAQCKTILLDNGTETEWCLTRDREPHYTVRNFQFAFEIILEQQKYCSKEKIEEPAFLNFIADQ